MSSILCAENMHKNGVIMKPSGIGGQAVIEGVMMKNKDKYAIAVRKPDKEIEIKTEEHTSLTKKNKILSFPVVRGVVAFIESLQLGMNTLTYSSSFLEEEEGKPTEEKSETKENVLMVITVLFAILLAIGIFIMLPFFVSEALRKIVPSVQLRGLIEGVIRVVLFVSYVKAISLMEDIKRVFMYHGAEHKTINCVENGLELTIENVKKQSKAHKRCGTSFLLVVMFVSILFFLFIVVDNMWLRMLLRLLLIPVVAGVAYEFIRLAGRSESKVVEVLSKPGIWLQSLTTKEPEDDMIEVAIASVDAVFDWKEFINHVDEEQAKEDDFEENKPEEALEDSLEESNAVVLEKSITEDVVSDDDEMEMVDLEETEEDDEILQSLDRYFESPHKG